MSSFVRGNIEFLRQAQRLIVDLSDALYRNNDLPPFNSGVGKHIRHILEFYAAFVNRREHKIDYDQRAREIELESNRGLAVERIEQTCMALAEVNDFDAEVWSNNDEAVKTLQDRGYKRSTVGRELQFLVNHTVHHFAVIAILLHSQGFKTPPEFGVAISTLAFWKQTDKMPSS